MSGIDFVLPDGKQTTLIFNGIALIQMEKSGADRRILGKDTSEGIDALAKAAQALAKGGEMAMRYMGENPKEIPSTDVFASLDKVHRVLLRIAVLSAIIEGTGEQEDESEEVDVGLLDLAEQNKKSETDIMSDLLAIGSIAGLNAKETLLLPIVVLNKLAEQNAGKGGLEKWRTI